MIDKMLYPNMWCSCSPRYTPAQMADLIQVQGFIPVSNADELNNINQTTLQTMGANSPWAGEYTTGADKNYLLVCNIDLSSISSFNPIGANSGAPASGIFDGNGLAISNMSINVNTNVPRGLFGMANGLTLRYLALVNGSVNVTTNETVSLVVGAAQNCTIHDCHASGTVVQSQASSNASAGLFAGFVFADTTIDRCSAAGSVSAPSYGLGGFAGRNDGAITDCYARTSVTNSNTHYAGGFCGTNGGGALLNRCYSTGAVSGTGTLGGFNAVGGGTTTASYWDTQTSGQAASSGGVGKTTAELKAGVPSASIYTGWSAPPWAFGTASDYPVLA